MLPTAITGNSEQGRISQVLAQARRCQTEYSIQKANNCYCPPTVRNNNAVLPGSSVIRAASQNNTYIPLSNAYNTNYSIPESMRVSRLQSASLDGAPRFSEYIRYQPLPPMLDLPPEANNAGKPKVSLNKPCISKNYKISN
jgi:hypothetical protein